MATAMVPGQRSLFGSAPVAVDPHAPWQRVALDDESWVDVCRAHLLGADDVLDALVETVPWHRGRRLMYDRMVDDPRLSHQSARTDLAPHPVLHDVRAGLRSRYGRTLSAVALNYYRDGRDSVAPHGDRQLRDLDDSLVAVLTLGALRPFRLRPRERARGTPVDVAPGSGDLLVMGGACQRDWEHAVPKVRACGPRVSATWRWARASR